jgi:hypothetical protein
VTTVQNPTLATWLLQLNSSTTKKLLSKERGIIRISTVKVHHPFFNQAWAGNHFSHSFLKTSFVFSFGDLFKFGFWKSLAC